jgi:sulfur-oxidizing protein SoxX
MRSIVAALAAALWATAVLAQSPAIPALAPAAPAATQQLVRVEVVDEAGVPSVPKPLTERPGDPAQGLKVVSDRRQGNCLACHQISTLKSEDFHGEVGPPLDGVGGRWKAAQLRMIIVNPKRVFTDEAVMPAFYRVEGLHRVRPEFQGKPILTAQQVEDVVAFLQTLQ